MRIEHCIFCGRRVVVTLNHRWYISSVECYSDHHTGRCITPIPRAYEEPTPESYYDEGAELHGYEHDNTHRPDMSWERLSGIYH